MKRKQRCWFITTIVCSVLLLIVSSVPRISAAEIRDSHKAAPLTHVEETTLMLQEKESADIHELPSGGDDGLVMLGALGLGILLLVLLVNAVDDDSE